MLLYYKEVESVDKLEDITATIYKIFFCVKVIIYILLKEIMALPVFLNAGQKRDKWRLLGQNG